MNSLLNKFLPVRHGEVKSISNCAVLVIDSNIVTLAIKRDLDALELLNIIKEFALYVEPPKAELSGIRMFVLGQVFAFLWPLDSIDRKIDHLFAIFFGIARRCRDFDSSRSYTDTQVVVSAGIDVGEVFTTDELRNDGPVKRASELAKTAKKNDYGLVMTSAGFERLSEAYKHLLIAKSFGGSSVITKDYFMEKETLYKTLST